MLVEELPMLVPAQEGKVSNVYTFKGKNSVIRFNALKMEISGLSILQASQSGFTRNARRSIFDR